ncbi:MAG: type II 3-dehydroquinate dehydratase [Polyangiaceae bacterium]|nr:type II 3-dehydroquinate dehydratase [Polyangiaceae bacterium]
MRVLVASGPNLGRLGRREPHIYGTATLAEIHATLEARASGLGAAVECRQTNHEGELLDWIGAAENDGFHGVVLNPGGLTHTSVALLDAVRGSALPCVEVHLSNPDAREAFRRRSYVAAACVGRIAGFGARSYLLALEGLVAHVSSARSAAP